MGVHFSHVQTNAEWFFSFSILWPVDHHMHRREWQNNMHDDKRIINQKKKKTAYFLTQVFSETKWSWRKEKKTQFQAAEQHMCASPFEKNDSFRTAWNEKKFDQNGMRSAILCAINSKPHSLELGYPNYCIYDDCSPLAWHSTGVFQVWNQKYNIWLNLHLWIAYIYKLHQNTYESILKDFLDAKQKKW